MTGWAIILTKPLSEEIAETTLRRAGYRVYLPRYRKLLRPHGTARRTASGMRPLLPGYIFAQDWRGWMPGVVINGISGVMPAGRGGGTATLAEADIALMMEREYAGEHDEVRHPPGSHPILREDLEIGEPIEMDRAGVLLRGTLLAMSANGRALIEAMIFGRAVRMQVEQDELRVVA